MRNNNLTKGLTILFFTVSLLDIIGVAINNSMLQMVFKPMIILLLMALYSFSVEKKNKWYLLALIFSFMGDVFLMDKNNLILYGNASFLMTQLIYIVLIVRQMERPTFFHKFLYAFLYTNYVVYLLGLLKPNLGALFYPVLIYGITIAVFGLVATLNYVAKRTIPTLLLMLGAFLFIASDSMIALNKFNEPQAYYPVVIMITYVLAQYLIFKYFLNNANNLNDKN